MRTRHVAGTQHFGSPRVSAYLAAEPECSNHVQKNRNYTQARDKEKLAGFCGDPFRIPPGHAAADQ